MTRRRFLQSLVSAVGFSVLNRLSMANPPRLQSPPASQKCEFELLVRENLKATACQLNVEDVVYNQILSARDGMWNIMQTAFFGEKNG